MAPCRALLIFASVVPGLDAHFHVPRTGKPGSETSGISAMLRDVLGGSTERNIMARWFTGALPDVPVGTEGPVTTHPDGMKEQTFLLSPMTLGPGEIGNKWIPMPWPKGHIAVKAFTADVVKGPADGPPPPVEPCCGGSNVASRDEVFMHHWTVNKWQLPAKAFERLAKSGGVDYNVESNWTQDAEVILADAGLNAGANGPCIPGELHLYFGIGNEVRGKGKNNSDAYSFPDPYGVVFDSELMRKTGQFMVLNTHLIDFRNVTNLRGCAECDCAVHGVKAPNNDYKGGLACCHSTEVDGGLCPVDESVNRAASRQAYYIRYTMKWRDVDAAPVLPLEVIAFDVTDNNTKWADMSFIPGGYGEEHAATKADNLSMTTILDDRSGVESQWDACHIEYYIPQCPATSKTNCTHRIHNSWEMPYPVDIVFVRSHFHVGGVNMKTRSESTMICDAMGDYDGHSTRGFELLHGIDPCKLGGGNFSKPVRIEKGERLYMDATYLQDDSPHFGVMGMSFVYAHVPSEGRRIGFYV
eukprot:TRINITY_DN121330_c0_g1_i1.p1 TRINITY_DN121330_c0_g1~~TRINITY_DN121330_c0_g1_i1.p1  ORF type:complete len:527 (-),score=102.27 TRINITY_DN121330_c0_g1_i1:195-1775(-)